MIRDFSKEELAPIPASSDTELTLGAGTLLVAGLGLFVLCSVCFGFGYAVGHRSSSDRAAAVVMSDANSNSLLPAAKSSGKPGAAAQMPVSSVDNPAAQASDTTSAPNNQADTTTSAPQVHSALESQAAGASSSSSLQVQPATQTQGWMVQIAAVSHPEDAEVLVDALRKRGYAVTARRAIGDNMIHVQTGPFVNRNDANAMRQKLLNDGYNAIVE